MPFDNPNVRIEIDAPYKAEIKILDKAYALIAKGWVQHAYERCGSYCLIGALNAAQGRKNTHFGAFLGFCSPVQRRLRGRLRSIARVKKLTHFNDEKGRRRAEVLNLLRAARASFE